MAVQDGFVALGSNLGDRGAHLEAGLRGLELRGLPVVGRSSVWETEPVDMRERLWFLNMVVRVRTDREPLDVLEILLEVEREAGRRRDDRRNAPRILDLDLLTLGEHAVDDPRLKLPHPRMWERGFVLAPLRELAPELRDPGTGRTVGETLAGLQGRYEVRKLAVLAGSAAGPV